MIKFKRQSRRMTALTVGCLVTSVSQTVYGMEENYTPYNYPILPRHDQFLSENSEHGFKFTSISSLHDIPQYVKDLRKGDVIFFDMDGVLFSKGGSQRDADLLDNDILTFFEGLNKKNVSYFGLTARSHDQTITTFKNLNRYGLDFDKKYHIDFQDSHAQYYKGILFSSNIHGIEKLSTKLCTLHKFLAYLKATYHPINRVIFIDDESFHFTQKQNLNFLEALHLFEFTRKLNPSYSSTSKAPPDLSSLTYLETKSGGTGGVVVLQDPAGKKWTLKSWENRGHGINECLGASLYKTMGGGTPDFFLYNDLPDELKQKCIAQEGLYRLAEYIEGHVPDAEELKKLAGNFFLPTALMSFWDVKPENYIVDSTGALYLIDTGGALLFRATGAPKIAKEDSWMPHQVSELFTFNNPAYLVYSVFGHKKIQDLKIPLQRIVGLRNDLLEETDKFCKAVHYKDKSQIRDFVESRLNHLEFLSHFYEGRFNAKADPFAVATEKDTAGTLVYADINGVPSLLIGERVRHKWWGNLGGKADPIEYSYEYLFETAARETKEESGERIDLKNEIQFLPSHDSVYVEEGGLLRRYRTYLVKQSYINPAELKNEEYTAYKWVTIASVLRAINDQNWMMEENTKTLKLEDGTILHPPFVESLLQPQIKQWLIELLNQKPISPTCTQSIVGRETLQSFEQESFHSNSDMQAFILALTEMAQDKERNAFKDKKTISPKTIPQNVQTASYRILNALSEQLNEKDINIGTEGFIINKILSVVNRPQSSIQITSQQAALINHIIDKEKFHSDKHVLYHGLKPELWFCYRVLSILRHKLDQTPLQTSVLRSQDSFFDHFPTAIDLLNYVIKGKDNDSDGFKAVGISCNPSLFSNLESDSSCTLKYFLEGHSRTPPQDIWNIIGVLFDSLKLPSQTLVPTFKEIFEKTMADKPGCLLQFFLDPRVTNQLCYASEALGVPLVTMDYKACRDTLSVLDFIKMGKKFYVSGKQEIIQFRLHSDLGKFGSGKIIVYDFFSDGNQDRIKNIDTSITRILEGVLQTGIKKLAYDNSIYSSATPALVKIVRNFAKIELFETTSEHPIVRAILSQNYKKIINLYLEKNGEDLTLIFKNPDTLETIRVEENPFIKKLKNSNKDTIKLSQQFIKEEMSEDNAIDILEAVNNLGSEAERVISLSQKYNLIHDKMEAKNLCGILKVVNELGPDVEKIINLSLKCTNLINNIRSYHALADLLNQVKNLGPDAEKIISLSQQYNLIQNQRTFAICRVLREVKNLGADAERVISLSQKYNLTHDKMNAMKLCDILKVVKKLGSEAEGVIHLSLQYKLIRDDMTGEHIGQILQAVAEVGPNAENLIEGGQGRIKDNTSPNRIITILRGFNLSKGKSS